MRPSPPGTKLCPQCGAENSLSAKFCKSDGYRFQGAAEAAPQGKAIHQVAPPPPLPAGPASTTLDPSTAPAQKVSHSGTAASRTVPTGVEDEHVAPVSDERPISTRRSPEENRGLPVGEIKEAPQPAAAFKTEPQRMAPTAPPEPGPSLEPDPPYTSYS